MPSQSAAAGTDLTPPGSKIPVIGGILDHRQRNPGRSPVRRDRKMQIGGDRLCQLVRNAGGQPVLAIPVRSRGKLFQMDDQDRKSVV